MPMYVEAVFSRRTNIPSFLTRFFTGGARWSHCGLIVGGDVIEALMFKGVVATPINEWIKRYPSYERVAIECPNPAAAKWFALKQVGKGYDYKAVIGVPWRSPWNHEHRWYCSELVEAALAAGGRLRWRLEKRGVSPMESWLVL